MMDRKRRRTSLVLRVDAKCRWSLVFERKIAGNQKAVAEDAHLDSDPGHCQISRRKLSRPYRTPALFLTSRYRSSKSTRGRSYSDWDVYAKVALKAQAFSLSSPALILTARWTVPEH